MFYTDKYANLKLIEERVIQRELEFEKNGGDQKIKDVTDKINKGEKITNEEKEISLKLLRMKFACLEDKISQSLIENGNLFFKTSTIHEEEMKILDLQIKATKLENKLYQEMSESLAISKKIEKAKTMKKSFLGKFLDKL